jgi:hypothetical protein
MSDILPTPVAAASKNASDLRFSSFSTTTTVLITSVPLTPRAYLPIIIRGTP